MKKYNLYLWLAVLVGLFASCSQDENAMLQTNESNRVSLTAELPDDFAQIGTRALPSVDDHTLRCILEVWTQDGTTLKHREEKFDLSDNNVVFEFTIDAGTYNCLFWADFIETIPGEDKGAKIGEVTYTHYDDKYYTTNTADGLKAISIIDGVYAAGFNTDARDAFFGKYELKKGAAAIENQKIDALTRPFAKLTIKENNATNYGLCTGLTAKYEVPKTFNVLTKAVENTKVKVTCSNKSSESPILFSDYIFADVNSNLGEVTLNFTSAGDKTFQTVTIPAGIPLKRNYKTNASGSLITEKPAPTDGVKMTVTMDANWAGNVDKDATQWDGKSATEPTSYTGNSKDIVNITSAAELAWLAQQCNGGNTFENYTFNLTTDIDLNNHNWTPIGNVDNRFCGNFNGQGHTVRNMEVDIEDADISVGFIGFMEGNDVNLLKVSNLIVEGNVKGVFTGSIGYAGGICGYASYVKFEFCRFNGTVSGSSDQHPVYSGGIVGSHGGGDDDSLTCCISDAKVTVGGQTSSKYEGGLVGYLSNGPVTYSAWNSDQTAKGVGEISYGDFATSNKSFTDITGLNNLLGEINNSKRDSEYEWKEGDNANAYPILVKRTPSGTN